jgi:O-antigen ligase
MAAHPIASAGILGLGLLMAAGAFFAVTDRRIVSRRHVVVVASVLLAVLALLTATKARGALLGMAGGIGVLAVTTPSLRKQRIGLLLVFVLVLLPLLGVGDQALTRTLIRDQSLEQLTSLSQRTELFEAAWPLVLQRPFFGHGFLATASAFTDLFPWAGEGHNVLLESAYSFGLVGTLAFVVLWVQIGLGIARALRSRLVAIRHLAGEMAALAAFILLLSVVGDSFAGIPGFETVSMMWLALMSDLLRRHRALTAAPSGGRRRSVRGT